MWTLALALSIFKLSRIALSKKVSFSDLLENDYFEIILIFTFPRIITLLKVYEQIARYGHFSLTKNEAGKPFLKMYAKPQC